MRIFILFFFIFFTPVNSDNFEQKNKTEDFDKAAEDKRERFVFAPFGLGPRICVGHRFSMIEATVILSQLLRHYKFTWAENQTVEPILSLVWTTKKSMRFNVEAINTQSILEKKS